MRPLLVHFSPLAQTPLDERRVIAAGACIHPLARTNGEVLARCHIARIACGS